MTISFDQLGLLAELRRAVADKGYRTPTPVQQQVIPAILEGQDIMAGAQTGTGKTAGFTLPLLQRLHMHAGSEKRKKHQIRALILTPTRELAAQVADSVTTYGKYLHQRSAVIFGGVNINPQIQKIRRGVDVLVATPGRLLDHAGQGTLDLSHVEIFVLDEADRMLDMGFVRDIRKVIAVLPKKRQNLLFSATYSDEIRQLADGLLHAPRFIEVARRNAPAESVSQLVHPVDRVRKRELLSFLVSSGDWHQVLVFTRTKHGANRLARQLESDGLTATAIHGNKSQGARTRALADFKSNKVQVLVATDIAARGLDINQLPHVVNFELPNVAEDYVHRIGRTGRAGKEGQAISLVCIDEHDFLKNIERLLKRKIEKKVIAGFEPNPSIKAEPILLGRGQRPPRHDQRHRAVSRPRREVDGNKRTPDRAAANGNTSGHHRSGSQTKQGRASGNNRSRATQNRSAHEVKRKSARTGQGQAQRQRSASSAQAAGQRRPTKKGRPGSGHGMRRAKSGQRR